MNQSSLPKVSIIIPCFNQSNYLPHALESVISQTLSDWECIVVDDGSSDNTSRVVEQYAAKYPAIRGVRQKNRGTSAARNRGLAEARGRYIQFLDADDFIAPNKLTDQYALLSKQTDLSVCICNYSYTDENGSVFRQHPCYRPPIVNLEQPLHDLALKWEFELSIPIHCFLFDARLFNEYGINFDQSLQHNEDWDCWMRIFALHPVIFYLDGKYAFYRIHDGSKTRNRIRMRNGFLKAIKKQQTLLKDDPAIQAILHKKEKVIKYHYKRYMFPWSTWFTARSTARALVSWVVYCCRSLLS